MINNRCFRILASLSILITQPFNLSNAQVFGQNVLANNSSSLSISLQQSLLQNSQMFLSPLPGLNLMSNSSTETIIENLTDISKDFILTGDLARQVYEGLTHSQAQTVLWNAQTQTLIFPAQKSAQTSEELNTLDLQADIVLSQA